MTGNLQCKGGEPLEYLRKAKPSDQWPPRFMKFILHFSADATSPGPELAFIDPRRLARIRLLDDPLKEPPICDLGFDPILGMPSVEEYKLLFKKRKCPVKALLLDQSFNAGVGNWVADEILYQARIHPEQRTNTLIDEQIVEMHAKTIYVCRTAVDVNADSSKFPTSWLFRHRWGKGKKLKTNFELPSGGPATIKWLAVGGRTSAYVVELQSLSSQTKVKNDGEGNRKTQIQGESKYFSSTSKRKKLSEVEDLEDEILPNESEVLTSEVKVKETGIENKPFTRASKRRKTEDESSTPQVKEQPLPKRTRKGVRR